MGQLFSQKLDADAIAYALQASERMVELQLPSGSTYQVDVLERDGDCLLLGFSEHPGIRHQIQVNAVFILKYSYFARLHQAIDNLPDSVISRLVPVDASTFKFTRHVSVLQDNPDIMSLEYSQNKALEAIMKCRSSKAPVLVIGSFGTGKTRLLARAAFEILETDDWSRVLICAHHQHSADSIITDYFAKIDDQAWSACEIFRLMHGSNYRYDSAYEEYYGTREDFYQRKREIRLVVTTFSTSLHLLKCARDFFTHILLDEGAQSREPESVAPLCLADNNTQIIIAGDHKQVSSIYFFYIQLMHICNFIGWTLSISFRRGSYKVWSQPVFIGKIA